MGGPLFSIPGNGVIDTHATQVFPLGKVFVADNGNEYRYMKATAAIPVNSGVMLDIATDATGLNVIKTAAAGNDLFGVAETAIASGSYGWITTRGVASCLVADGVAAADPLGATSTAGTLAKITEAGSGSYKFVRAKALAANSSGGALAKNIYLF